MMSIYLSNKLLDHSLGVASYEMPSPIYIGLFTVVPIDGEGGTEVTGAGYARQVISVSAASSGLTANTNLIQFPIATEEWGTIVAAGIWDALTDGNWLFADEVISASVKVGNQYQFSIGNAQISMS